MTTWRHRLEGMLLGLLIAVALAAFSGPYAGIALGEAKAQIDGLDRTCDFCTINEISTVAPVYKGYVGYRYGNWALEAGAGSLSHYDSHRAGPAADTSFRDIRQQIDTRQRYVQAMRFIELGPGTELFGALGLMRVTMKNHEWGCNDGAACTFIEQTNYDVRTKPVFGLGVAAKVYERVAMRLELTHVRHIAVSRWTKEQNATVLWLGLQGAF